MTTMLKCDVCSRPFAAGDGQQTAECCLCDVCCARLDAEAQEQRRRASAARRDPDEDDDEPEEPTPLVETGDPVAGNWPP